MYLFIQFYLLIYFWLCWGRVFVAAHGLFLSSCQKQGLLFFAVYSLPIAVAPTVMERGL